MGLELDRARIEPGPYTKNGWVDTSWMTDGMGSQIGPEPLGVERFPRTFPCYECGREVTLTLELARRVGRAKRLLLA